MKPRLLRSHMTDSSSWMSISFTSDGNSGIPLQFSLSCLFLPSSYEFWDYRFTIMPFLSAALDQTNPELSTCEANVLSAFLCPNGSHSNRDFSFLVSFVIWYIGYIVLRV